MLKKILAGLVAVIAIFVGIVATRPETFEIKRSLVMNASPEVVQAQITNFKTWTEWSPWEKSDPAMKKTYDGAAEGVGAHYAWDSAKGDVGAGEMKITEVQPGERVGIDLHFTRPFEANNHILFETTKTGDTTTVSWVMSGKNSFGGKAMSLFMDMDKLVGGDFDKGLASLKTISEAAQAAAVKKAADDAAAAGSPPNGVAPGGSAPAPAEAAPAATDAGTP